MLGHTERMPYIFIMCYSVYLGSPFPLRLIADDDDRFPGLHVIPAEEKRPEQISAVRSILGSPSRHYYYACTDEGCGCRFCYDDFEDVEASIEDATEKEAAEMIAEWHQKRTAVESLASYLRESVEQGEVDLYIAWMDEEGEPIERRATVTPDHFGGTSFNFGSTQVAGDRQVLHVVKSVAHTSPTLASHSPTARA